MQVVLPKPLHSFGQHALDWPAMSRCLIKVGTRRLSARRRRFQYA